MSKSVGQQADWDLVIPDPYATTLKSLLKHSVNKPWRKPRQLFDHIFIYPTKKAPKGQPKGGVPVDDDNALLSLSDAEKRNKIFAWIYFLDLFFRSPFGCASQLMDSYCPTLKQPASGAPPTDEHISKCVFECMNKIFSRMYLDRLPSKLDNSEMGNKKYALFVVGMIVDFNTGHESLNETKRYLSKLPGGQGDLSNDYQKVHLELVARRYKPFDQECITSNDVEFMLQVFHQPTRLLSESIMTKLAKIFTENVTAPQKRYSKAKKTYAFHVNRQVNSSWMKIVLAVGSVVRPTASTGIGKYFTRQLLTNISVCT
jgi:hypothetical protein